MASAASMKVPIARTSLTKEESQSILEPVSTGWLVQGPFVDEFEKKWSDFVGVKHSIATTSCTSAMELSLAALGFGPGDEAILPAFTWVATANVVEHLGGKVVFCDIDLNTFNIDVKEIERKITQRTKVLMPVHLFGLSADMGPLIELSNNYGINIVEDAACGFGSLYDGTHVGAMGNLGCFSFHPRKAITTGEGGMITSDDSELAEKLRCMRDHGATVSDLQRHMGAKPYLLADHTEAGYNYRMTDIQGALGSAQMDRASLIVAERRELANRYNQAFKELPWLRIPHDSDKTKHGYQSYPCLFQPETVFKDNILSIHAARNRFMDYLNGIGVSTRPATHAVHRLSYYKNKYNLNDDDFHNAFVADTCSISLPLFHGMTSEEQNYVINSVKEYQP